MPAQRQAYMAIILHHLTAGRHPAEHDGWFVDLRHGLILASCGGREEREGFIAQRLDRPKRFVAEKTQCGSESIGLSELGERR